MRAKTEQKIVTVNRRIDIRNRKQSFIDCKEPVNTTVHLTKDGHQVPLTTRAREVWTLQQNVKELVSAGACDGDGFFFKGDFIAALIDGEIVGKSAKVAFKLDGNTNTLAEVVEDVDVVEDNNFEDWHVQVSELNELDAVEAGAGRETDESEHNELNDFAEDVLASIDEPVRPKSKRKSRKAEVSAETVAA